MVFIISVDHTNLYRAKTRHFVGAKKSIAHKNVDDVFWAIIRFLSHGQRKVSYAELAEVCGRSENTVKYYVSKLVNCKAVRLG